MSLRLAVVPAFSSLPGLVHGFGQRRDPGPESREETVNRVRAALEGKGRLLLMRQVHGAAVVRAPWEGRPEGDAAVATRPGLMLGIATADCLPVLLVDPTRRIVAAAHAGWRGTAAGVASRVIEELEAVGSRPGNLLAALGPGIGPCCYDVGEELRAAFGTDGESFFSRDRRGRDHLDVRAANVRQLEEAGLRPERIHHVEDCTSCRGELYYSYRRDGAGTGRMVSFVGFEA